MQRKKEDNKISKSQLIMVGSLFLVLLGLGMIGYKYFNSYRLENQEQSKIDKFINTKSVTTTTDIIESDEDSIIENPQKRQILENIDDYIAVIEIPKINLRKGLYSKDSSKNNVNTNIEVLDESDMPDQNNGNFILAGHSGSGRIAYFRNLNMLEEDDIVYVYYQNRRYEYKLVNSYEIEKTGVANILRNSQKNTLTLITCKHNTNKQIVFLFELVKDGKYNE